MDNKESISEEKIVQEVTQRLREENRVRIHYYVKIAVSTFLCVILLAFGVPIFIAGRMTGSFSYTSLSIVFIVCGLALATAAVVLVFRPPWKRSK